MTDINSLESLDLDINLVVEKRRHSDVGSTADNDLELSPSSDFKTAPSSPFKRNAFFSNSPNYFAPTDGSSEYTDDFVVTPSVSPGPRIPPALRGIEYPALQPSVNVLCDGAYDTLAQSKNKLLNRFDSVAARGSYSHGVPSPLVLIPQIKVTPAIDVISESSAAVMWVAIQITAKLAAPTNADAFVMERPLDQQLCIGKRRRLEGQDSWYGCLYDLDVKIIGAEGCMIEDIIKDHSAPQSLATDENLLFLVKVVFRAQVSLHHPARTLSQCNTIEDYFRNVETYLGSVNRQYLSIRVTYNHTGFPDQSKSSPVDGVKMKTTLETWAEAFIRVSGSDPIWAHPPKDSEDPSMTIPEIVSSQGWNPELTQEALQNIGEGFEQLPGRDSAIFLLSDIAEVSRDTRIGEASIFLNGTIHDGETDGSNDVQLPPVSPTRMKLLSVCPLRRSQPGDKVSRRQVTPMPMARPIFCETPINQQDSSTSSSPSKSVDTPTKSHRRSSWRDENRTLRRRRSWFFF